MTFIQKLYKKRSNYSDPDQANTNLLPIDFNPRSPDNLILSVALKYKDDNPMLLTSDNGLQIKCKGLGISTVSLKEFIKR